MDYGIDIVEGVINDTIVRKFEVKAYDGTTMFTSRNPLVPASTVNKGWWSKSIVPNDSDSITLSYFALNANNVVVLTKDLTWPKIKIKVQLPDSNRYSLSEFHIIGHFRIDKFNMVHLKKAVPPKSILDELTAGNTCKIGDLRIEKLAEPVITTVTVKTAHGDFVAIEHTQSLEI